MKKEARPLVWHKKSGKILSAKVLNAKESPTGREKKMAEPARTPTEFFLRKLRQQIQKSFFFYSFCMAGAFYLICVSGCIKKEDAALPVGNWKREGSYVGGKLVHERRSVLTLTESAFKMKENNCESRGRVSYQPHVMILKIEKTDCPRLSLGKTIYYGFDLDPADGKMRIFYNNQYNDTIKDVYVKIK